MQAKRVENTTLQACMQVGRKVLLYRPRFTHWHFDQFNYDLFIVGDFMVTHVCHCLMMLTKKAMQHE